MHRDAARASATRLEVKRSCGSPSTGKPD